MQFFDEKRYKNGPEADVIIRSIILFSFEKSFTFGTIILQSYITIQYTINNL